MLALFLYVVLIVLIGWLAIWVLGQLAPGHPAIIDNIIWVVVVRIIIIVLTRALGVADVPVPRL